MFRKVDIPVLGVVENMSLYECPKCGELSHLFGAGGGERVAAQFGVPLLGELPLASSIREQADGGNPTVAADPDGVNAGLYRDAARHMAARLWAMDSPAQPVIGISDD